MLPTTSLPCLQEPFIPTALRDSILTLLGPSPDVRVAPRLARSGSVHDVQIQRLALIAYRAKIAAVMAILEVGVRAAENKLIAKEPERSTPAYKPACLCRTSDRSRAR